MSSFRSLGKQSKISRGRSKESRSEKERNESKTDKTAMHRAILKFDWSRENDRPVKKKRQRNALKPGHICYRERLTVKRTSEAPGEKKR